MTKYAQLKEIMGIALRDSPEHGDGCAEVLANSSDPKISAHFSGKPCDCWQGKARKLVGFVS